MENFRTGIVASTVARVHGHKTNPRDFYPKIGAPVEVDTQSRDQQIAILFAAAGQTKPS